MFDWLRRAGQPEQGQVGVMLQGPEGLPEPLRAALEQRLGPTQIWPALADARSLREHVRRARPAALVVFGDPGLPPDLWRDLGVPLYWINAPGACAAPAVASCVRSLGAHEALPHSVLTGDPLLGLPADAMPAEQHRFCDRFQEVRDRQRWILYFAESVEPEEDLAYQTFLRLSRRGVGLLVLAPKDPARHETVYRDAMRFHLLTNRHRRLMTSYVPHKTRVYYLEDAEALRDMYGCADVVVAGGSFGRGGPEGPELVRPLSLLRAVVVGPQAQSALCRAAVADGAIRAVASEAELESSVASLLLDPAARASLGSFGGAWLEQQRGALSRVLAAVAQW